MQSKTPSDTIENIQISNEELKFSYAFPDEFAQKNSQLNFVNNSIINLLSAQRNEAKREIKEFKSPRALERLADIHFLKKNYSRAKKYYLNAVSLDENLLAIYEKLILICLIENKFDEVDEFHKKILSITNRRPDYLHRYILFKVTLMDSEKALKEAFNDVAEIVKKNPSDATFLNTYGFLYLKKDDYDNAKNYFEKALEINPDYAYALNNLGVCYGASGDIDKAIKFYNDSIKIAPKYSTPYENLANCYNQTGKLKETLAILENAVSEEVSISDAWQHHIGWLYVKTYEYKKAIDWYLDRIKKESSNGLLYNNLGHCYFQINKIKDGKKYLKKAAQIFEYNVRRNKRGDARGIVAFYNLGRIALVENDSKEIKMLRKKILKYSPDDAFADYLEGTQRVVEKKYAEAKELFLKSFEKRKDIPEVYADLSFVLVSIEEDYQKAIDLLESALKLGYNQLLIINNLIYAYIENGNLDKAEKLLKIFDKDIPAIIYTNKGLLAFRNGDLKNGDRYYEKALKMLPEKSVKIAKQYWDMEKCKYYMNRNDRLKAEEFLNLVKENEKAYLGSKIDRLIKDYNKIFKITS